MRSALIDADILAYQAAAASEQSVDWGDGLWTLHAFEAEAIRTFETNLHSLLDKVQADKCILAFSDKSNWRKSVLPTYKSNRVTVRKPMLLKFLREYCQVALQSNKYQVTTFPELEGDDVIGILATTKILNAPTHEYIICSLDKDFKTIPGKHYNFGRDEFFEITEHQADYWHMFQALTGDATDGYSGCRGCGPKTAEKILKAALDEGTPWANPEQLRGIYWEHVVAAYAKAGFGEEEALTQARVARILRCGEYNFDTNQVELWKPNGQQLTCK